MGIGNYLKTSCLSRVVQEPALPSEPPPLDRHISCALPSAEKLATAVGHLVAWRCGLAHLRNSGGKQDPDPCLSPRSLASFKARILDELLRTRKILEKKAAGRRRDWQGLAAICRTIPGFVVRC